MQEIVGKYPKTDTDYILPIIKASGNERQQYSNALCLVNNKLKEISAMTGLQNNLTMYVSRHSWASIAKSKNVTFPSSARGWGMNPKLPRRFIWHRWTVP